MISLFQKYHRIFAKVNFLLFAAQLLLLVFAFNMVSSAIDAVKKSQNFNHIHYEHCEKDFDEKDLENDDFIFEYASEEKRSPFSILSYKQTSFIIVQHNSILDSPPPEGI